jgi:hypothetical protein
MKNRNPNRALEIPPGETPRAGRLCRREVSGAFFCHWPGKRKEAIMNRKRLLKRLEKAQDIEERLMTMVSSLDESQKIKAEKYMIELQETPEPSPVKG